MSKMVSHVPFDNSVCGVNKLCFDSNESEINMKGREGGRVKGKNEIDVR
jgi:hypothetical protein